MTPTPAVAIVGGGPTGLALALTLARLGVASTVLEHRTAPTPLNESRAITWDARRSKCPRLEPNHGCLRGGRDASHRPRILVDLPPTPRGSL